MSLLATLVSKVIFEESIGTMNDFAGAVYISKVGREQGDPKFKFLYHLLEVDAKFYILRHPGVVRVMLGGFDYTCEALVQPCYVIKLI